MKHKEKQSKIRFFKAIFVRPSVPGGPAGRHPPSLIRKRLIRNESLDFITKTYKKQRNLINSTDRSSPCRALSRRNALAPWRTTRSPSGCLILCGLFGPLKGLQRGQQGGSVLLKGVRRFRGLEGFRRKKCFPNFFGGPGALRQVREAGRNNFILCSSKTDLMVPNYDPKAIFWVVVQTL